MDDISAINVANKYETHCCWLVKVLTGVYIMKQNYFSYTLEYYKNQY